MCDSNKNRENLLYTNTIQGLSIGDVLVNERHVPMIGIKKVIYKETLPTIHIYLPRYMRIKYCRILEK